MNKKRKGLELKCFGCGKLLKKPGALLFAPPVFYNKTMSYCDVQKYHICVDCYDKLFNYILGGKLK